MTSEEKDLINQIRSEDTELSIRENALSRLGEICEESYILDLCPSKMIFKSICEVATSNVSPVSLRRKAKALFLKYQP